MQNLKKILLQLESKIPFYEKTNPSVSNSTVGWQIEHSLKTITQIVLAIKNSNPQEYQWKFNKSGYHNFGFYSERQSQSSKRSIA